MGDRTIRSELVQGICNRRHAAKNIKRPQHEIPRIETVTLLPFQRCKEHNHSLKNSAYGYAQRI